MDRCGIIEVPSSTNYVAPLGVPGILLSSSLSDSSNKGLYSLSKNLPRSTLYRFPLCVDPV